ncbi:MAG: hypothetical protein U1E70_26915 [Acetobacteraceae bacterium]
MRMWHIVAVAALVVMFSGAALAHCGGDHATPTKTSAVGTASVSHFA